MVKALLRLVIFVAAATVAFAQSSTNFKLEEYGFNAGGRPHDGATAGSASFTVTLDALGDSVGMLGLIGLSYKMSAGFVAPYPPPGEVVGLVFSDKQTLEWNTEPATGAYNLYRDAISNVSGLGYGNCEQQNLPNELAVDADLPPANDGYFYLVTAENFIADEGTKGVASDASKRGNLAPCP